MEDLRRAAAPTPEVARRVGVPQSQRLWPLWAYEELDLRPFRDFLDLPELRAAVELLVDEPREPTEILAIFSEPAETPWCMEWHRDFWELVPDADYGRVVEDPRLFSLQMNAALYADSSLWIVPGSHFRGETSEEAEALAVLLAPPRRHDY